MFKLDPLTAKKLHRFRTIKRGYWSFVILMILFSFSFLAELFVNNRAVFVSYKGNWHFPTYGAMIPGKTFDLSYSYETNYRQLAAMDKKELTVVLPVVPYDAFEIAQAPEGCDSEVDVCYPPFPPSLKDSHYLGTDTSGRDVFARLIYGFRVAILFSLLLLFFNYLIGVTIGCMMGYFGGRFDIYLQRLVEIWSNVPFLYIVMIVSSIIIPNFWMLAFIMIAFGWMGMTWYMRTATYKEKAREYVMAARALGASTPRIIFNHILPNTISLIVTFIPFSVVSGITSLTTLDYLGYGLPPPTPSWGELMKQGTENLQALWIVSSVVTAMVALLIMVTFVGEAVREAFDPKKYTYYE